MKKSKNKFIQNLIVLIVISLVLAFVVKYNEGLLKQNVQEKPFSEVLTAYQDDKLKSIDVDGVILKIVTVDDEKWISRKEPFYNITENFDPKKISISVKETTDNTYVWDLFITFVPFLLIVAFFIWMMRKVRSGIGGGGGGGMGGGLFDSQFAGADPILQKPNTNFKDVAGNHEAKEDLIEVVDFLKEPKKYQKMGAQIPKGVLMVGEPGTGKTLMAKAIAGEANVPFFSISGSEFEEMFVGVGASRVRELFKKAKKNSPSIIFIDEIDAVGKQRGTKSSTTHHEQTLNQILVEMDGFETGTTVIVIAATNRPDVLDPALLRPGRFDRRVTLDMPDISERKEMLEVHARNKPFDESVNFEEVAKHISGFSGADISNLLNESAILATKRQLKRITVKEIEDSIEKLVLGSEKKARVLSDKEKKIVAYHESGHAIIGHLLPNTDPVHKVTIVSRGRALGVTWFKPEFDKKLNSENKFKDEICSLLGGYLAEKIIIGENTTGASNDLQRASAIARAMVTEFGMSPKIGTVVYKETQSSLLGELSKTYSDDILKEIEEEVSAIIFEQFEKGKKILEQNKDKLDKLAKLLLEKETLSKDEFVDIMGVEKPQS